MSDITKAQDSAEAVALMIAQYYQTLKRENVPDDVAQLLTAHYQESIFKQSVGQQALTQLGQWLKDQKK